MKGQVFFKFLIVLLISSNQVFAQINSTGIGVGVSLGNTLLTGIGDKKKLKNIEKGLADTAINGILVVMLRVKEDKIISNAKYYILKIQDQLDSLYVKYKNNQHIGYVYNDDNDDISSIESLDYTWPVYYYKKELIAYRNFENGLIKKEKEKSDSVSKPLSN